MQLPSVLRHYHDHCVLALTLYCLPQIPVLVQAGYRVVAPDLKGFGQSDKPQDPSLYIMPNLLNDVLGILDQLDIPKVHCVVGHDWGSALAWQLAGRFPKRFERLVALSVGHNASMFSIGGNKQREKSWYMLFFKVHTCCCWPCKTLHAPPSIERLATKAAKLHDVCLQFRGVSEKALHL